MTSTVFVFLLPLSIAVTYGAVPYKVTIAKTTVYTPKTFKYSTDVLLDQYEYMNPDNGYTVKITEDICTYLSLKSGEQAYKDDLTVHISKTGCDVESASGSLAIGSAITFVNVYIDGNKTESELQAQAKLVDTMSNEDYSTWLFTKIIMPGLDTFKTAVDNAALQDYGFTPLWYNRDYKEGNSGAELYSYEIYRSLFKLCEVTESLGKSTTTVNFHDAVNAGVDCKNMNYYKCVSFCILASTCKSVFFYEGPMDQDLKEPRYLCVQLLADLDDKVDRRPFLRGDSWEKDFYKFTCPAHLCDKCTHRSDGGVSACRLREFLKTIGNDENRLFPFVKKTGSKIVFNDHIGSNRSAILADMQKYIFSSNAQEMGLAPDGVTSFKRITAEEECWDVKASWTNMVAEFPVTLGAGVTLSCKAGYELVGDKTVTCLNATEFQFSVEPNCVACPTGDYKSDGMTTCQRCEIGKEPSDDSTQCVACPTGHYKSDGMTTCQPCEVGKEPTYDSAQCVACPAGHYKSNGMTTCQLCAAGQESSVEKTWCVDSCLKENEKVEVCETELKSGKDKLVVAEKKVESLESELKEKTEKLVEADNKVEYLENMLQLQGEKDKLEASEKKVESLETELKEKTDKLVEADNKVEVLETVLQLQRENEKLEAAEKKVEVLETELKEQKDKLQAAARMGAVSDGEICPGKGIWSVPKSLVGKIITKQMMKQWEKNGLNDNIRYLGSFKGARITEDLATYIECFMTAN